MAVLLDTTVLIDALRGRPAEDRLRAIVDRGEIPYVCAVTAEEIHRGLRPGEHEKATRVLGALHEVPLRVIEGALAGTWRRQFAARGITLGQGDCLIAAAAVGVHATIATGNPEDFPMEGVTVDHWPVGA